MQFKIDYFKRRFFCLLLAFIHGPLDMAVQQQKNFLSVEKELHVASSQCMFMFLALKMTCHDDRQTEWQPNCLPSMPMQA